MADKQVNININYKVNTVEVQKAEQLLKQAQTASTAFENTAKKAGQTSSTAFKTAGLSIQEMNAKLLVLKDRITQSSDPSKIKRLSDQYKQLKTQIDAANKSAFETPKAIDQTTKSTQSLAGQLGGLYTAVKLAFTAGIIKEVVTTTLELAKLAGNVEGVSRAFNRSFANPTALLEKLKQATHGTVTEFELMQRTLQATNLGVAVEQLPILFEFAAARAQQTGESVDYLVDSIVRGIGRKSILVLDNLGLSATRLKEQFNGASLASQSVADVTRGVAEIARVELEKMGGYAETSATKVDQLTTNLKELRIEASQKIESSWLVEFFDMAVTGARELIKTDKDRLIEQARLTAAQQATNLIESKAFKDLGDNQQKKLDFLQQEANSRVQLIGKYNDTIAKLKEERAEISKKNPYDERLEVIQKQIRAANDQKVVIASTILALKTYIAEIGRVNAKEEEQLGIIEKLQKDIEQLGDDIRKATSVEDIERLNRELVRLEVRLKELNELGKNRIDPLASITFDIKKKLSEGKVKLETSDLIDTQSLEADTEQLFHDLGVKAGKEFSLGTASGITDLERVFAAAKDDLEVAAISIAENALIELANIEADNYDLRLRQASEYYDNQLTLAGDNQKAKEQIQIREKQHTEKLRREQAKKEKQAAIFSIIISTAAAIAKTAATLGYPAAIPGIIIAAAEGAAQLAVVNQRNPGFKDGVLNLNGKGNGTSDSIPARLSKGESVMTAKEWQTSKNVLQEVRAKKLDDKVLADLKLSKEGVTYMGGFNDKNILSKLDEVKNAFPDIEERAGMVFTSKVKTKNYRMMVRKSSMSS